jgi:hypothetical protein
MPLAPRLAPLADDLDLFMTLNRKPSRTARGMEHPAHSSTYGLTLRPAGSALALGGLDIEALAAHGHDQSLVGECCQGPLRCAVRYSVLLGEGQDAGHAPGDPAVRDHRPQYARYLLVQGHRRIVIDHARHDAPPVLAPA